jgi:predicted CopG family antitoxin
MSTKTTTIRLSREAKEGLSKQGLFGDSFNDVIIEVLKHHEAAVKIIGNCERCKVEFKEAVKS